MLKKQGVISTTLSPIQSLKFSAFNYFGMGAVLAAVAQSFWINFSAYYLNNILPSHGNLIFLLAQIFEGIGILLGWLILAKFGDKLASENQHLSTTQNKNCLKSCFSGINLHMLVYITGAILLIMFLPLTFFMPLSNIYLVLTFSILSKTGSGLMIISQITIIPKITHNRSRRRKLVEKVTQFGLGGTFISMFSMTFVSVYVNFIWKYFIGVCVFVFLGGICSIVYVFQIRMLVMQSGHHQTSGHNKDKVKFASSTPQIRSISQTKLQEPSFIQHQLFKSPKFYIYALILIFCTLYMDIVIAIYPYFIKSFQNISQFRYLSCISALYLSAFACSLLTKNAFVFSGIRSLMSVGFVSCTLATVLLVIGLADHSFDTLMIVGTCLTGVAKVIAINCAMNLINQFIGKEVKGRQFVYGIYYFLEKVITGFILYSIISRVYLEENTEFLHFSQIYLPFILYALTLVLVIVDRSLLENPKIKRNNHIVIVEDKKHRNREAEEDQKQNRRYGFDPSKLQVHQQIDKRGKLVGA